MKKRNDNANITLARGLLLPAFIMLLVAALTFVSASYAWFSTTIPYNLDDIGMSAGSKNGEVYVSADCEHWASTIEFADLMAGYEGSANMLPTGQISPVSSAGIFDDNGLAMFAAQVLGDTVYASRAIEPNGQSTSGDFYAYDLFFRSSKTATLFLGEDSDVYDVKKSSMPVSSSARVAFVNYGNAQDSNSARGLKTPINNNFLAGYKAVDAGALLNPLEIYYRKSGEDFIQIKNYELNWDLYDSLLSSGNLYVIDSSVVNDSMVRIWEPNAAVHTDSITVAGALETRAVISGGYVTEENTAKVADDILFNDLNGFGRDMTFVASVKQGYNKVRIYIWLEGQDADAINEVSGNSFSVKLQFVLG